MEIQYKIDKAYDGYKIGDFLKKQGYSKRNILALKRYPEKILVNGKWEFVNYILKDGDELMLRFEEVTSSVRIEPQDIPIDIIYEDEDILVVNKPPFMPIHPTVNHEKNTLANAVMYYYQKQGLEHVFRCMNRLDANTSGLTIMANTNIVERSLVMLCVIEIFIENIVPLYGVRIYPMKDVSICRLVKKKAL